MDDNKYSVSDLIVAAYEQKPIDFEQIFSNIVVDRVSDVVNSKRVEVAQNMYGDQDNSNSEE
jgi:hypothetical protein